MTEALRSPLPPTEPLHRVAIVFAGGPAPGANAVISTAAASFLRAGTEVIGIRDGYENLVDYDGSSPLRSGHDYVPLQHESLGRGRSRQGVLIGTSRANPGKHVSHPSDLDDPARTRPLRNVHDALVSLDVDGLISIGGDDTLKTANKLAMYQARLPEQERHIPVVHVPKTIDNDYMGIDFTFGYFTAVEFLANEIRNLLHDAEACSSYFVAEAMGRSAGWLAYGAAIAGEASLVISVEDITGDYLIEEETVDSTGARKTRPAMDVDHVLDRMVKTMRAREAEGKPFGVIVLAEGLAELLPQQMLSDVSRDDHGHISIAEINLGRLLGRRLEDRHQAETGVYRKVRSVVLGYESRCAQPHAFDVMLGSQLGVGAFRALVQRMGSVMVSVTGQLDLRYVPFDQLIDPDTLVTVVRYIETGSDFHKLARFLEVHVND